MEVLEMSMETIETEDNIVVPASVLVKVERHNGCGSVPGLDDDELADPAELERWVIIQEWGPILALPVQRRRCDIRPEVDESGHLDWGAFGTIDFDRIRPAFDKVRYKMDRLREELKDAVIMLSIVSERIPGRSKYMVLKYLRMGVIDIEHIANDDMRAIAKWYLRTRRLGKQIEELRQVRKRRWLQALEPSALMQRCPACGKLRETDEFAGLVCGWCDKIIVDAELEAAEQR